MRKYKGLLLNRFYYLFVILVFAGTNFLATALILRAKLKDFPIFNLFSVGKLQLVLILSYISYTFVFLSLISKSKRGKLHTIILWVMVLVALIIIAGSFYLNSLETVNYPNFIFSVYGIYLPFLKEFSNFQVALLVIGFIYSWQKERIRLHAVSEMTLFVVKNLPMLLVSILVFNSIMNGPRLISMEYLIFKDYFLVPKEERKEAIEFGDYYERILFIKNNTPEDSTIIHPTQSNDYPDIGNQPFIRYYLFPRRLVTASKANEFFAENPEGPIYTIIAKNVLKDGVYYPDYPIETKKILIRFKNGKIKTFYDVVYTLEFIKELDGFQIGLLEHRHD